MFKVHVVMQWVVAAVYVHALVFDSCPADHADISLGACGLRDPAVSCQVLDGT